MRRAVKVTLDFATRHKRQVISNLLEAYRGAVNFYIQSLWKTRGKLNADTLARLTTTRLSERYKSQALKQALEIVVATKKSAKALRKAAGVPVFRGAAVLDAKFVSVESGQGSFDLIVRLSTLNKGARITIPTKRTAVINKWFALPLAKWLQGCALSERGIILWVDLPTLPIRTTGSNIGIDVGVNKLIATSDGQNARFYGTTFKTIRDKVKRRKSGSNGKRRAIRERDNFINRTINTLPWCSWKTIAVEDLKNVKKGKRPDRSKDFRKAMAPWTYRRVLTRLGQKAEENRVLICAVPPAYTSRICPACSTESKKNRVGEIFCCISCGYTADADFVGATNVLARTTSFLTSIESVRFKKAM